LVHGGTHDSTKEETLTVALVIARKGFSMGVANVKALSVNEVIEQLIAIRDKSDINGFIDCCMSDGEPIRAVQLIPAEFHKLADGNTHRISQYVIITDRDGNEEDEELFTSVWEALAEEGKCDSAFASEYCRTLKDWLGADKPEPIAFILKWQKDNWTSTLEAIKKA
jgi:hypothetical protein